MLKIANKKGISRKKLKDLIKDENMAYHEYKRLAKENPEFKDKFKQMSGDEASHSNFLQWMILKKFGK